MLDFLGSIFAGVEVETTITATMGDPGMAADGLGSGRKKVATIRLIRMKIKE